VAEGQPLRLRQHDSFRAIDTAQLHVSSAQNDGGGGKARAAVAVQHHIKLIQVLILRV